MGELTLKIINLIDANIADIKAKTEKDEISLKTCQERTDELSSLKLEVIKEFEHGEIS